MTEQQVRREMYEQDKLLYAIQPYGLQLIKSLKEALAIAEKYERRDGLEDARKLLANIQIAINESN
jgi:hypothetical protein